MTATPNESKQFKQDKEEEEPVKPNISSKTIHVIKLTELVLEIYPSTERSLKFKRGIQKLLVKKFAKT